MKHGIRAWCRRHRVQASAAMLLLTAATGPAFGVDTLPVDISTKGNWIGTYGSCSYVLAAGQGEVRCQMPVKDPAMAGDPACDPSTCPDGVGGPLTCGGLTAPLANPRFDSLYPFNYQGGATNSLMDCAKTTVGESGAQIRYFVRRCNTRNDAAGGSAQGWVWNSRIADTWDPDGCMTTDPSALEQPGACLPPELGGTRPLGLNCTNPFDGGRVASTWDDAMEIAGVGSGGAELCVDIDFSDVPDRAAAPYQLSAYMLDYDRFSRVQDVFLYECGPGDINCEDSGTPPIAGPTRISGFQDGTYLSWVFDGDAGMPLPDKLTIRVSRVASLNAVLSGLFLDRTDSAVCAAAPDVKIKKFTNGWDGDDPNGLPKAGTGPGVADQGQSLVAQVEQGGSLNWTYVVTNTGAEPLTDVTVTDDRGVTVACPSSTLDVGASMTCTATGTAEELTSPPEELGCGAGTDAQRPTYVNVGTVDAVGQVSGTSVFDEDPSAYCNPPDITIVKFTNGHDGDTANGVPDPDPGSFTIGSGTVAEVAPNGEITWTYRVTNTGPVTLVDVRVEDDLLGMADCPFSELLPGETRDCTLTGFAEELIAGDPNVQGCGSGGSATRPTYMNNGIVTATDPVTGETVEDVNPSHYCNPPEVPECSLELDKTCEIVPPPSTDFGSCDGKLQQFTMIWPANGGTINISGIANDAPGGVVSPGQKVTFIGPFPSNDNFLTITGAVKGQSVFHVSCSDKDMDGENSNDVQPQLSSQDCGKFEGNGKSNSSSFVNDWLLDGLVDSNGDVLNCSPTPPAPQTACSFQAQEPPQCGTGGSFKPDTLTFQYTGGDCSTSSNSQEPGKTKCNGTVDPTKPATVTFDGKAPITVAPSGTFTVARSDADKIELSNSGGTQELEIHTSCSQPLIVGDVYYSLTLVAEDGIGAGQEIKYGFTLTNTGMDAITGITVEDNQLGLIGSGIVLAGGESKTLTKNALIEQTTTNVAQAYDDNTCAKGDVTASVTVTVLPPPPCTVSQVFDKVDDNKYKVKLTNDGSKAATLESLVLSWPAQATYGSIKKVKFDGDVYKLDDSALPPVVSGDLIGPNRWTELKAEKRQLDPGKSRTLEIEFSKKWDKKNCPNGKCFSSTATFAQGCTLDLGQ